MFNNSHKTVDLAERERVEEAARWLVVHDHKLYCKTYENEYRYIPFIAARHNIIKDAHDILRHCHGEQLYLFLRKSHYWPNLRNDCLKYCAFC